MTDDTISRSAAMKAVCIADCLGECNWYPCAKIKALLDLPPAQPTLYGYDIKHLAFVASIMAKKGLSPEEAVTIFRDVNRVIEMMLEDMRDGARRTLEQMVAEAKDGTV